MSLHRTFKIRQSSHGFTLIELMITIAIAAILLMIGIPSFQAAITSAQLTTQSNNLLTAIATARSEAIKNNSQAVICSSNNSSSNVAACNGASWADGWIIFIDTDQDGALDAGEVISNTSEAARGVSIAGNANVASRLRFRADGTLNGLGGTIRVCKVTTSVTENARDLIINTVGRTRIERKAPAPAGTCPAP